MQNELRIKEWVIDERTGYLRHPTNDKAITPEMKETFLEALKKLGTASGAARFAGFSPRLLSVHKRADLQFKQDYDLALEEMAHTLEGVMYLNAMQPKGTLDRFGWLRAHYPKKWNPKFIDGDDKDAKKAIDSLWKEIHTDKK